MQLFGGYFSHNGSMPYQNNGVQELLIGTNGQVLTVSGGIPQWIVPPSQPLTTKGDVFIYNQGATRLPIGLSGQVLGVSNQLPAWQAATPLTTNGDVMIYNNGAVRLPAGTNGQVLTMVSGLPAWSTGGGGGSPLTTSGDMYYFTSTNARLPIGSTGQVLTVLGGLPSWQSPGASSWFGTFTTTDPNVGVVGLQAATTINITQSGLLVNSGFGDDIGLQFNYTFTNGWNQSDQVDKITVLAHNINFTTQGQGQKTAMGIRHVANGMGDEQCAYFYNIPAGGVNAGGDEGQLAISLQNNQLTTLCQSSILSVTQSSINTTTTQAIVANGGAQTVTVASTTGLTANQWVIVDPATYDNAKQEAVQITALTGTSITGVFRRAHTSGVAVIGAVVLNLNGAVNFGQSRLLVNLTQTPYTTGTAFCGGQSVHATGVGTTWQSAGLAGATANNQGAISFVLDDMTVAPWSTPTGTQFVGETQLGTTVSGSQVKYLVKHFPVIAGTVSGTVLTQTGTTTTLSQAITGSVSPQTINVGSTIGMSSTSWVQIDTEDVQLTAITPTSITGVFQKSHLIGATVTLLNVTGTFAFSGLSNNFSFVPNGSPSPTVNSGVATNFSNGRMDFTWSSPPVGSSIVVTYSSGTGPLRAWHPIGSVIDDTHLNIIKRAQVGNIGYQGLQNSANTYMIAPAALIMSFNPTNTINSTVVLSANSFTWNVGDQVECAISPMIDTTTLQLRMGAAVTGGNYQSAIAISNVGWQIFNSAINISNTGSVNNGNNINYGWQFGIQIGATSVDTGIKINAPNTQAMLLLGAKSNIAWSGIGACGLFMNNYNSSGQSLELSLNAAGNTPGAIEQGKITGTKYGANGRMFNQGGAYSLSPAGVDDESFYQLINTSGQFLRILGNGANNSIDMSVGDATHSAVTALSLGLSGGTVPIIGAYGAPRVPRPTVTGDKTANLRAVVASLLAALSTASGGIGWLTDSTTG